MEFKASIDTTAKIITTAIAILFFGLLGIGIVKHNEAWSIIGATSIPLLTLIGCWFYHPISFILTASSLIIRRPIGNLTVDRKNISTMAIPDKGYISGLRTFGVGGVFGYFGKFYNPTIGHMTWYTTKRDNVILVTFNSGKKIVISPDDAAGFVIVFGNI